MSTEISSLERSAISEWLGAWWKKLTHRHAYRQIKNWGMLDGQLVCVRMTQCDECGHVMEQELMLIATAAELVEAYSNQIASHEMQDFRVVGDTE